MQISGGFVASVVEQVRLLVVAGLVVSIIWERSSICFAQDAAPPSDKPAAETSIGDMTLHIIPQSHIDLAWFWRYEPETTHVIVKHTLDTAFGNMEKFPDYTFTYLQVPAIEPIEALYPDLFSKLRYFVHNSRAIGEGFPNPGASEAKGRLAIGSPVWCEFDGCVPSGESLVRHFLYGKRYFLQNFGVDVKTAWVQDAWTHPWTLPQIMKKSGVDSYMFTRPRGEGEPMFWWESADGSRVFAYKPLAMEDSLPPQPLIDKRLLDLRQRYGVADGMVMVGVGNHGGGAIRADVERMRNSMARRTQQSSPTAAPPKMIFSTPERFVQSVLRDEHPFPVVKSELAPTIRGAYTSRGEIKRGNRQSESLLMELEAFSAIAARLGVRPYPQTAIFDAWKKVMLNQFHDTISGTDIQPSIADSLLRYRQIAEAGLAELDACRKAISRRIDTTGPGTPIVVFNPLAWERTDAVEIDIPCDGSQVAVQLADQQGNAIATQVVRERLAEGKRVLTIVFVAEAVPSLGYKSYRVTFGDSVAKQASSPPAENTIENAFFRVQVDSANGCLRGIFDKKQKRDVLAASGKGNAIQVFDDLGDSEGFLKSADGKKEHNVWDGKCADVETEPRIEFLEQGPVRTVVEIKKKFGLARFTQRVILLNAVPRIDFELAVAWNGVNKMVKVGFPLAVSWPDAAYEIPYGAIRRPSDGQEQAAQNWVDISASDYGVALLNDSRYGFDLTPNTIRMSVLRSPTSPVFATDGEGTHIVKYSLYPHQGGQDHGVVRRGMEFNHSLSAIVETPHHGDLPAVGSFVKVEPENVVLSVLKKAEDGDHLVVRCYETDGKASPVRLTWGVPVLADAVHSTDLLENSREEVTSDANGFTSNITPYSIDTYKLIKDPR